MELHNLKPAEGAVKNRKRIGRGEGSKRGGTPTRGHKIGFEGGQQPLQRRVPKFGFTNPNRKEYNVVNLDTIQNLFDNKKIKNKVSKELLIKNGLVQKKDLVKILARGEFKAKIEITANAFSSKAIEIIEKLGGKVNIIE